MFAKKMTIAGLACLLAVEASGCGNTGGGQVTSIRIGVSVYDQYDTFVSEMINHFNEYASEVSASMDSNVSVNIDVYNAAASQTTQNNQVKTMLEDGCDIICVNLVDRTEPVTIIDMAEKKDVPVIFFNRELVEQDLERWDKLYYVGAKAFESGIMQGEMAADIFKNDPAADKNGDGVFQYIMLEGEADHQDAIVRTEYAVSTITDQGVPVEKLGYAIANWNRAQANTKMSQLLTEYGDQIELVLANNDDMALGAVDAMKAAGIDQAEWPVILGIDGTDVGLAALKNGEIRGTVYNDKEGQAEKMFDLAFCLARGLPLDDLGLEDGKYIRQPYTKLEEVPEEQEEKNGSGYKKNDKDRHLCGGGGGYLLYLAYQLFGRLSESTGLSYTVSLAAMVLFAAGGAGIMIFGIRQLILLAKNGVSEFDKQPGPSEQDLSENVSSENEDNPEK